MAHDIPFLDISDLEDEENIEIVDSSANITNPNKDHNKRYFQERRILKTWDYRVSLKDQPNRLRENGPVDLDFPGHFYQVEGGICVICFEKDRSSSCLCTITQVNETERTFHFQVLNWIGKSKKTWFQTGKIVEADAESV